MKSNAIKRIYLDNYCVINFFSNKILFPIMKMTIIIKFDPNFPLSTVRLIYRKSCINNNKQTERDQDKFFGRRGSFSGAPFIYQRLIPDNITKMAQIMISKPGEKPKPISKRKLQEKGEKMEFPLSDDMPNIVISYEVDDDFGGFHPISEETKEKYTKIENFMQKSHFHKLLQEIKENEDRISQEKFVIRSFPDPNPKPSGSQDETPQDNEDTMEDISEDVSEPSESEDEMDEIKYEFCENSSKKDGNTIISDNHGFSYSWWRGDTIQYFRCIIRHNPQKSDCGSYLTVKNRGEENQQIIRNQIDHNHQPNKNLIINRKLKIDLKQRCIEKSSESSQQVIDNVLDLNVHYQKLYNEGDSPKLKSLKMLIMRHRKKCQKMSEQ